MHRQATRRHAGGRALLMLGLGAITAALCNPAAASCASPTGLAIELPQGWQTDGMAADPQEFAATRSSSSQSNEDALEHGSHHAPSIVGTWRFTFVSDGTAYPTHIPFGAALDFGTTQWHSDGTEFTISGGRPPSTGDVCMGSWKQIGANTFSLRHITLTWVSGDSVPAAPKPAYIGPGIIRESIKLNKSGDRFEGTFTIDQYSTDEVTLLEHIGGKVSGKRFTAE